MRTSKAELLEGPANQISSIRIERGAPQAIFSSVIRDEIRENYSEIDFAQGVSMGLVGYRETRKGVKRANPRPGLTAAEVVTGILGRPAASARKMVTLPVKGLYEEPAIISDEQKIKVALDDINGQLAEEREVYLENLRRFAQVQPRTVFIPDITIAYALPEDNGALSAELIEDLEGYLPDRLSLGRARAIIAYSNQSGRRSDW